MPDSTKTLQTPDLLRVPNQTISVKPVTGDPDDGYVAKLESMGHRGYGRTTAEAVGSLIMRNQAIFQVEVVLPTRQLPSV